MCLGREQTAAPRLRALTVGYASMRTASSEGIPPPTPSTPTTPRTRAKQIRTRDSYGFEVPQTAAIMKQAACTVYGAVLTACLLHACARMHACTACAP